MTLRQKQSLFARNIANLIQFAYAEGYEVTFGDAYRDPRVHGAMGKKASYSSINSNHKIRLAVDLNLFLDGKFLTSTDSHRLLGTYWETLHPDNRWGGRFNDGNHYEMLP